MSISKKDPRYAVPGYDTKIILFVSLLDIQSNLGLLPNHCEWIIDVG